MKFSLLFALLAIVATFASAANPEVSQNNLVDSVRTSQKVTMEQFDILNDQIKELQSKVAALKVNDDAISSSESSEDKSVHVRISQLEKIVGTLRVQVEELHTNAIRTPLGERVMISLDNASAYARDKSVVVREKTAELYSKVRPHVDNVISQVRPVLKKGVESARAATKKGVDALRPHFVKVTDASKKMYKTAMVNIEIVSAPYTKAYKMGGMDSVRIIIESDIARLATMVTPKLAQIGVPQQHLELASKFAVYGGITLALIFSIVFIFNALVCLAYIVCCCPSKKRTCATPVSTKKTVAPVPPTTARKVATAPTKAGVDSKLKSKK